MNMQKCMDNDACTAWVTHKMYQGFSQGASSGSTASTGGDAATGSTDATADATGSGSTDTAATGSTGSTGAVGPMGWDPSMVGFPLGFQPARYGLDYDALPVDCMDDSKCARGLMMYTAGSNMGGSLANIFQNMYIKSRLQKARRLSRPRYGVPYRYGRQY